MPYEVELYGNTGAGKTVLLTALYNFVLKPDNNVADSNAQNFSQNLDQQRQRLLQHEDVERTDKGIVENLSFQFTFQRGGIKEEIIESIDVLVKAHAGEDHVPQTNETYQDVVNRIKAQFIDNDNKLLVIVVNPFWHDIDLAWKAFRNLVAYLQEQLSGKEGQPLAIKDACYVAANILFHLPQDDFARYFINLNQLFQNLAEAQLIYDIQTTESEQSFRWKNCTDANAAAKFNRDFKSAIGRIVDSHQGDRVLLQNLMRGLENSMLVLSHVDLATQLKSIDIQDFDKVINLIFANPNRSYRRQLLAKNFTLHVGYAENGEIEIRPSELLTETASQFYENIKSFAIEPEIAKPLPAVPVEESEKTPPIDLSPLVAAIESLVKEEKEGNNELGRINTTITFFKESLTNQMQESVSQAKQGKNELSNINTEIGFLNEKIGRIDDKMEKINNKINFLGVVGWVITAIFFIALLIFWQKFN
jgi:hypothetical protein